MSDRNDYLRTTARLLGNALRFRLARLRGAPIKPEVVSLAITNRCNSHCIMCNMWRSAAEQPGIKERELTLDEIIDLLSRPLFSELVEVDITGGEPHLRDDLADIALGIAALKPEHLPHLRTIVITSNGLMPERVTGNYRRILEGLRDTGIDLVTVASIDGIGAVHDKIRGTKGAYERAVKTLDGIRELTRDYPDYFAGLKTTVLPHNIDSLYAILEFARERDLFHIISPVFFTETRFRNSEREGTLHLGSADREKLLWFYERRELDGNYFYSRIRRFLSTGRACWACTASFNYLFIEYDGTVYPCELLSEPLGNLREQPVEAIWNGPEARRWRRRIGKTERCRRCIEPGAVRYSAYSEGTSYLGFLRGLGGERYTGSLDGEGFRKYFRG